MSADRAILTDPFIHSEILAALGIERAVVVIEAIGGPSRAVQRRRLRDQAVRAARQHFAAATRTGVANDMARELLEYVSRGTWRFNRMVPELTGASAQRQALHRIAQATGGRTICRRTIFDILDGTAA